MAWQNLQEDLADLFGDESFADAMARALPHDATRIREDMAARRERFLALGLCPCCGAKRDQGTRLCALCALKDAARKRALVEKGLCPQCGLPADRHTRLCSICTKKHADAVKAHAERNKNRAACRDCGSQTDKVGKKLCGDCTRKQVARNLALRARYRSAGLCIECGSPPAAPGRRLCAKHAAKKLAAYHARKAKAASVSMDTQPSTSGPRHTSPSSALRP